MNWMGICEFVSVAETMSFTQAAKKLATSTAQVSRQITALEQRLNIKLFYRTTRKVSLTYEGEIFYKHCRQVLDDLDKAERAVSDLQSKPQGKIKLTAPITYGEQKILPLVNSFSQHYSNVIIDAYLTNQQVNIVDEGYDLAIRLGKLKDSTLMATKLGQRKVYLCASPSYLARYGTPTSLATLTKHNCLLGSKEYWGFNEKGKERKLQVTGSLRFNNGCGLLDAALKGIGIVQLPDHYVSEHLVNGSLTTILTSFQEPDEEIWAVYPYNKQLPPKIRLLIDYLKDELKRRA
jgi:DNA-binding transcriptional LysR family regulator